MYVKVMAAVIACILLSGEAYSALATTPATENLSWFKKKKKKNSEEERVKALSQAGRVQTSNIRSP